MPDIEKRVIGGLAVHIDRLLCVGFGDCLEPSARGLELDEDGIATFTSNADAMTRDQVIAACKSCPVDAILVLENGAQIAP